MKFNLNDFLQLDANGLLAVNGGNSCSTSSSSSGSDSSSGTPNGSSPSPGGGSVTYNPNNTITYRQKNGQSFTYRTSGNSSSSGGGNCNGASDGKTVYSNPYYGGNKGAGGSTSNNPNGQGASVTTTATTVGGSCSKTSDPKEPETPVSPTTIESGTFAQITDDSYAGRLTMQYYRNNPSYMFHPEVNDNSMNGGYLFSESGCLMTAVAKVASEITGKEISLIGINNLFDKNIDGLLEFDEINNGFNELFGKEYNIEADYWENKLSMDKFIEAAEKGDTYVLARVKGDFDEDGTMENHWVVLEGYSVDAKGRMIFSYDRTSDNDDGRTYIYGDGMLCENEYRVDKIETFRITRK